MTNEEVFDNILARDEKFLDEWASEFISRVKDRTPVKTGRLRDGFEISVNPGNITLTNEVEYFPYIEDGTLYISPRRMVARTLMEADQITEIAHERSQ